MLLPIVNSPASAGTESAGQTAVRPSPTVQAPDPVAVQATEDRSAPDARDNSAKLQDALDQVKAKVKAVVGTDLRFETDKDTGQTVVQVVDAQTNQVIRQIPSDEMLAIARNIDHMKGLLLKQKA